MKWPTVTIGDYLVRSELRDPTKNPHAFFRYVDVSSVDNTTFTIRQSTEMRGGDAPSRARKVIRCRDVIFATVRPTLRRIALVGTCLDDQICSTGFCVLRAGPELDPGFLYYWLLTDGIIEHVAKIEKGVSYPAIRDSDVKAIQMPHPPLAEQRQIARILLAVQRAIERQERLITLTAELKKALMHKLFSKGTRGEPLKQTEVGPVPESWFFVEIGTLGKCVTGTTPPTKIEGYYTPDEYCFLSPADLGKAKYATNTEKKVSEGGLRVARELPRDSILCVCIGSSIGKTGMTYHHRSCTNQQINAIVVDASSNPHFVYYLLTLWSEHWRSHATFGPVPIINKGAFEKVQVPFTSDRGEQDRIADVLSAVDSKIEHHTSHRDSFAALFRTLLHQLMTAQVRVCDLDLSALNEPAAEAAGAT